jgi:hypothetical protein
MKRSSFLQQSSPLSQGKFNPRRYQAWAYLPAACARGTGISKAEWAVTLDGGCHITALNVEGRPTVFGDDEMLIAQSTRPRSDVRPSAFLRRRLTLVVAGVSIFETP